MFKTLLEMPASSILIAKLETGCTSKCTMQPEVGVGAADTQLGDVACFPSLPSFHFMPAPAIAKNLVC